LEWAHLSKTYLDWVTFTIDVSVFTHFGFILEEVQAFKSHLDAEDATLIKKSEELTTGALSVWQAAIDMGVNNFIYSTNKSDTLAAAHNSLRETLHNRQGKYDKELARQIANDQLCQKFASAADPFSNWITSQKDKVSTAQATLEDQLKFVKDRIHGFSSETAPLSTINDLNHKMDEAGITYNKHTTLAARDVEVQCQQYQSFMNTKSKMLEEEIETAKLRGMTAEQIKEIDDIFIQYDQNKDRTINRKELKACLYSLGEEKTNNEVDTILKTYGDGNNIQEKNFKEFMIQLFGDTETQESVLNGFRLINKSESIATADRMKKVMLEYDVNYIVKTSRKSGDGHDFVAWTSDVFSR